MYCRSLNRNLMKNEELLTSDRSFPGENSDLASPRPLSEDGDLTTRPSLLPSVSARSSKLPPHQSNGIRNCWVASYTMECIERSNVASLKDSQDRRQRRDIFTCQSEGEVWLV